MVGGCVLVRSQSCLIDNVEDGTNEERDDGEEDANDEASMG